MAEVCHCKLFIWHELGSTAEKAHSRVTTDPQNENTVNTVWKLLQPQLMYLVQKYLPILKSMKWVKIVINR